MKSIRCLKAASWLFMALLVMVAISNLQGCGDGRPDRVTVSGQVFLDGQPLKGDGKNSTIQIVPTGARPAFAEIDQDGHFTLTTFGENDGCVPGTHRVSVTYTIPIGDRGTRWMLPKKYANHKTSGLEAVIEGPTKDLKIDLTWDGGKPFDEMDY